MNLTTESPSVKTKKQEVKVLYDNDAIYISALIYDNEPHKIHKKKEITNRDVFGVSDHFFFSVSPNGFNADGQQDYTFYVMPLEFKWIVWRPKTAKIIFGCHLGTVKLHNGFWL
jgi:hypothetical protein